jgi:integration host factor subunit alpha
VSKTITRETLAEAAYQATGVGKSHARDLVEQCLNELSAAIIADSRVVITGFGAFHTRAKGARLGRNPKSPAEQHTILARRVVIFRPALELRKRVWTGNQRLSPGASQPKA